MEKILFNENIPKQHHYTYINKMNSAFMNVQRKLEAGQRKLCFLSFNFEKQVSMKILKKN